MPNYTNYTIKNSVVEYSLKMKLFSKKAAEIIDAGIGLQPYARQFSKFKVIRMQDGEVRIETESRHAAVEHQLDYLSRALMKIGHSPDVTNTVKTRAADEREYNGFKMRDYSLLGYILRGYSRKSLVAHFGQEAVDEMIGKPCNPLETTKRTIAVEKIDRLRDEKIQACKPIWDKYDEMRDSIKTSAKDFSEKIRQIVKLENAELAATEKPYYDEIAKLRAELF